MHFFLSGRPNLVQISLFFASAMFCLPFVIAYHQIPIPSFYNEWTAALCGIISAGALFGTTFGQHSRLPASALIFLGLLLLTSLQALCSSSPQVSSFPLIQSYLIWAFLVCILGGYLREVLGLEKLTITLSYALIGAGAINVVFIFMQIAQQLGLPLEIKLPSYGMLGQNNNFADFTALAMISLLHLSITRTLPKAVLYIGLLLGLIMLTLSGARSSILYLAAITFWSWKLHLKTRHTHEHEAATKRRLLYTCMGLFPAFIAIQLIITIYFPQALTHPPIVRAAEIMASHPQSLRWQFWQTSLYLFQQSPLLGVGTGQMRWQTFLLVNQPAANPAHIFFEHAHNLFLHLLAESGIFAPLLVLAGLTMWIWHFLKRQSMQSHSWWLLSILSVIGIHSMLEYPLWYAFFLGITAFLLGAGDMQLLSLRSTTPQLKMLLRGSLLTLGVYGIFQLASMYNAYHLLEKQIAIASKPSLSPTQKQALVEDMIWVSNHTLMTPVAELVLATFLSPHMGHASEQLPLVESAVRFMPLHRPLLNMIILLDMNHRHNDALQHLRSLKRIAGADLKKEIMNMPPEQIPRLQLLLREAETTPG